MNGRQRGVALLMVLLILVLMMVLASAITERTARMYQQTATTLDNLQARWYALGAETMVAALLQRDALDSPNQTHLAQNWAQQGRRFTVDDGEIYATITDDLACFNLMPSTAPPPMKAKRSPPRRAPLPACWRSSARSRCAPCSSPPPCATGSMRIASRCSTARKTRSIWRSRRAT
nr:General secretion pathway protein K [Raoultella sp. NCTC 9187]